MTDPADYRLLLEEMRAGGGAVTQELRFQLACKAFSHTAAYDGAISNYLTSMDGEAGERRPFPATSISVSISAQHLRYGENPHQHAAFYRDPVPVPGSLASYTQLQGKELSYNNIADADAAWECVKTFDTPACVIIKHANPCGVAVADTPFDAYKLAFATDPTSAFGGIIAFNRDAGRNRGGSGDQAICRGNHRTAIYRGSATDTCPQSQHARFNRAARNWGRAAILTTSSAWAAGCWYKRLTISTSLPLRLKVVTKVKACAAAIE